MFIPISHSLLFQVRFLLKFRRSPFLLPRNPVLLQVDCQCLRYSSFHAQRNIHPVCSLHTGQIVSLRKDCSLIGSYQVCLCPIRLHICHCMPLPQIRCRYMWKTLKRSKKIDSRKSADVCLYFKLLREARFAAYFQRFFYWSHTSLYTTPRRYASECDDTAMSIW